MSKAFSGSSSQGASTPLPAGSEAITAAQSAQRDKSAYAGSPTADNPQSHLRNALQILELRAYELRHPPRIPDRRDRVDGETAELLDAAGGRIQAAVEQLDRAEKTKERHAFRARDVDLTRAYSPAQLVAYARAGVLELVDHLVTRTTPIRHTESGDWDPDVEERTRGIVRLLNAATERLARPFRPADPPAADKGLYQVATSGHASELNESPRVAAELLKVIGPAAAAALTGDLLDELSRAGYLLTWSAESTRQADEAGVYVVPQSMRDEYRRRREGMRRGLEEMDETNREISRLRLVDDGPLELHDADRAEADR